MDGASGADVGASSILELIRGARCRDLRTCSAWRSVCADRVVLGVNKIDRGVRCHQCQGLAARLVDQPGKQLCVIGVGKAVTERVAVFAPTTPTTTTPQAIQLLFGQSSCGVGQFLTLEVLRIAPLDRCWRSASQRVTNNNFPKAGTMHPPLANEVHGEEVEGRKQQRSSGIIQPVPLPRVLPGLFVAVVIEVEANDIAVLDVGVPAGKQLEYLLADLVGRPASFAVRDKAHLLGVDPTHDPEYGLELDPLPFVTDAPCSAAILDEDHRTAAFVG